MCNNNNNNNKCAAVSCLSQVKLFFTPLKDVSRPPEAPGDCDTGDTSTAGSTTGGNSNNHSTTTAAMGSCSLFAENDVESDDLSETDDEEEWADMHQVTHV